MKFYNSTNIYWYLPSSFQCLDHMYLPRQLPKYDDTISNQNVINITCQQFYCKEINLRQSYFNGFSPKISNTGKYCNNFFYLVLNHTYTVQVIWLLSSFYWWKYTSGFHSCIISGTNGHLSRTTNVPYASWIKS